MILGLMAIADDYRLSTACAVHFSKYVDHLIFRYDVTGGYDFDNPGVGGKFHREFFKRNEQLFGCKVEHMDNIRMGRHGFQFLGDFDKRINEIKPDLVFTCDSDEMYPSHEEFWPEVLEFLKAPNLIMYHRGTTVMMEGNGPDYAVHCKVSKYVDGMSYYHGRGKNRPKYPGISKKATHEDAFIAEARMRHFCFFDEPMRKWRLEYANNRQMPRKVKAYKEQMQVQEGCV